MAEIHLKHGDHVDALNVRHGITIVTSRGYPYANRRQRLIRKLFARFM